MTTTTNDSPRTTANAIAAASARRLAATPTFAPLPPYRPTPPRARRHSVRHRSYR